MCLNYAQAGIFQTVLVFITMVSFLVLASSAIMSESIDDKKRSTIVHTAIRFAHDMLSRLYLENCLFCVNVVFLRYCYF